MKNVYLDHVAVNDIKDLLYAMNQHFYRLQWENEMTNNEKAHEVTWIVREAKELLKAAKDLKENFDYDCIGALEVGEDFKTLKA